MQVSTAFAVAQGVGSLAQGFLGRDQAAAQAANLASQAYLAGTQAVQNDANRRSELVRTISGIRAGRAANGLSLTSPTALKFAREAEEIAGSERLIKRRDAQIRQQSLLSAAQSARRGGALSLLTGAVKAAPSLFSLFDQ